MQVEASTDSPLATGADTIVVTVFQDEGVAHDLPGGELEALLDSGEASRSFKRLALTHHDGRRVLLVGLGPRTEFSAERAREAAGVVYQRAQECGATTLCWEVPHHVGEEIVEGLVTGTLLAGYRFDRYKPAPEDESPIERLIVSAHHDISAAVARAALLASAQNRARDLGNTAPNDLTPTALADYAVKLADRFETIEATILDGDEIRSRGMGAFAAVAQGSDADPRLIELRYEPPGDGDGSRIALVGKAVTFDSGGLSIKPATGMMGMKFDMCGGAAVIEAIAALAELRAPVRVLGVVGATENMLNGHSVKVGDVVTALDGTTIEVNNTDAEGRMVLADCLAHARQEGCDTIVDIATLTGGVVAALGNAFAGLMCNDEALAQRVTECGQRTGERVWRLPLDPIFAEMTKSRIAQLTNRPEPRVGLASAAAEFLHHFAGDVPWAHLDMAGVSDDRRVPYLDRGGSGWGARLLAEVALSYASA
ncbi:MAG: leucyl aminopeptidase family protein [Solirubrobacteraceae bacterium]